MYVNLTFRKFALILCDVNFICVVNVHRSCPIMRQTCSLQQNGSQGPLLRGDEYERTVGTR